MIWGDKKYVLPSLLPEFSGEVDLIYIDPPRPDWFGKLTSKRAERYSAKWFRTICRKVGVRDFKFHDLRHTFASRVRLSGYEVATIKDLLRHKDIKSTLRYAHIGNEHLIAAVEKAGAAFKPKPALRVAGGSGK